MESAASVLGYAQRVPTTEVVSLPTGTALPKSMSQDWRVVNVSLAPDGVTTIDGLPTWNVEGLLAGIATRPSGYKDLPGLAQWLPDAAKQADISLIIHLLSTATAPTRQRVAYLLAVGDNSRGSEATLAAYPPQGPAWFGTRSVAGKFNPSTRVNDTALHPYLQVGAGS
ncbi:MAG: type IV toxin-antitoxin system AbiEi family antitoxin [Candidatus Nanopelagicales bacterium]